MPDERFRCKWCKGTGFIASGAQCRSCGGRGWYERRASIGALPGAALAGLFFLVSELLEQFCIYGTFSLTALP
jgi:RecJ-like exonuclease